MKDSHRMRDGRSMWKAARPYGILNFRFNESLLPCQMWKRWELRCARQREESFDMVRR
jgi:hypothetical protein